MGQWNGTTTSNNVGIGVMTPTDKLHVVGNIRQGNNLLYSDALFSTVNFNCRFSPRGTTPDPEPFKLLARGFSGQFTFGVGLNQGGGLTYSTGNIGNENDQRALIPRWTILNSGLVGIGTTNPTELLQISGGNLHVVNGQFQQGNNYLYSDGGNSTLHFNSRFVNGAPFRRFSTGFSGSLNFSVGGNGALVYSNSASGGGETNFSFISRFAILNNGVVAIGADAGGSGVVVPSGYLLAVKGKIICEELKVKLYSSGWADYVFDKNYKLAPLLEVEKFIEINHHLPSMPSAKQLEESEGLSVSEMFTKQQEKIEELTLYLIQQHKTIKSLEDKVELLSNKK